MLESITVKNLALIKQSEITLRPGLNILTGETGAGKSIILGSIRLALGEKASKDIIRRGEEYALIELVFTSDRNDVLDKLKELDVPIESDGTIIITRKILESRSTCKCNGETISSKALRELASMLINIHGQNDTQTLLDARNYRDILDDYGDDNLASCKAEAARLYHEYRTLEAELKNAGEEDKNKDREIALAKFEIDEIEAARIIEGEDEELEERYRVMKNSQKIAASVSGAHSALDIDNGAGAMIGAALRELGGAAGYAEEISGFQESLRTVEDILKSTARDMQDYLEDMEFSPQEYNEVESRLDTYNHLKDKYGNTVTTVLQYLEERKSYITKMEDYDAYIANLTANVNAARKEAVNMSLKLSDLRIAVAKSLEEKMINNLKELNFQDVRFEIAVNPDENNLSKDGIDTVDFNVSFNLGEPVKSLSQVASGGELSRFMLALKAVTADKESIETLVFDEIDSGISGKTAWNVSQKMAVIGKEHQVIAITHLPQIAAMADSHYLIEKKVEGDSTITDIYKLSEDERERELARMLSGGELTDAGLTNARELIDNAKSSKIL